MLCPWMSLGLLDFYRLARRKVLHSLTQFLFQSAKGLLAGTMAGVELRTGRAQKIRQSIHMLHRLHFPTRTAVEMEAADHDIRIPSHPGSGRQQYVPNPAMRTAREQEQLAGFLQQQVLLMAEVVRAVFPRLFFQQVLIVLRLELLHRDFRKQLHVLR